MLLLVLFLFNCCNVLFILAGVATIASLVAGHSVQSHCCSLLFSCFRCVQALLLLLVPSLLNCCTALCLASVASLVPKHSVHSHSCYLFCSAVIPGELVCATPVSRYPLLFAFVLPGVSTPEMLVTLTFYFYYLPLLIALSPFSPPLTLQLIFFLSSLPH